MSMLLLFDDGPNPSFDLNFMAGMPAGLTYTNSSTERIYWDATGTRRSAVANEPIFETLGGVFQGMRWEMEQRTNLAKNSEGAAATWLAANVADAATPIAGFAQSLQFGDKSVGRFAYKQAQMTLGDTYTTSVFIVMDDGNAPVVGMSASTGDFCLVSDSKLHTSSATVIRISGSLYRVSSARVVTIGGVDPRNCGVYKNTAQSARTFRVAGIQVEAGASASSYIPTAAAAVTRQPDVLTASSISWYRQDEGTVLFEGIVSYAGTVTRGIFAFSNGTASERIGGYVGLTVSSFFCVDGGVTQADLTTIGTVTQNSVFRHVGAYKVNDFAGVLNGGAVRTDTSGTVATPNQLRLGGVSSNDANPFMGYARRFQYFNTRLPDAQIQGMSRV